MTTKTKGLMLALSAYLLWGLLSLYWKQLSAVGAYDIFAYRMLWTVVTMLLYMLITRQTQKYRSQLNELYRVKTTLWRMVLASVFITLNWIAYIWAVTHHQATEASLGYYVMPLVSIVLSVLFLKESLTGATRLALLLVAVGVAILIYQTGSLPTITLILAFSFALYGLIKKGISLSSDVAMLFESGTILPLSVLYLLFGSTTSLSQLSLRETVLVILSGVVTAIPLLLFSEGVKRAPLNQVGFIQYINPTIQLLIAVFYFGESISSGELYGFICIWLGVLVFIVGQIMLIKKRHML
ncbi:EamA family transporter RarD [Streptococcus pluranimalium]